MAIGWIDTSVQYLVGDSYRRRKLRIVTRRHGESHDVNDSKLSGQTLLVTGGGGFVGSHLVRTFVRENDVRVIDDFSSGRRDRIPEGVTVYEGDIRDESLLETAFAGVDCVFHTAGLVSVEESIESPVESHDRNSLGTVKVLEQARTANTRVVFSSSAAIYGSPSSLPIVESDRKSPQSPYGVDKLTADRYVRLYDELYDLETVSLRYFNVYGPLPEGGVGGGVISEFVERALRDEPIPIEGDGTQTRDFVHVHDVVRSNILAATTSVSGRAFNVGSGESISIERLARTIQHLVPTDPSLVYEDNRPGDIDASRADISAIAAALGFAPTVALEDGLAELVEREGEGPIRA